MTASRRIVRVPLNLDLIGALDDLVRHGVAGYTSREELISDAVRDKVLELQYGLAPQADSKQLATFVHVEQTEEAAERGFELTVLKDVDAVPTVDPVVATSLDPGLLYGLHNRDYPTLWALQRLAHHTQSGPVPYEDFMSDLCEEAWRFAERLDGLSGDSGLKLDALFPKNRSKTKSAEAVFRDHAVGAIRMESGSITAYGPFFKWQVAGIETRDDEALIALTQKGLALLRALSGVSLDLPHSPDKASAFLRHLRNESPSDWAGFRLVLTGAYEGISRPDLIDEFQRYGARTLGKEWTRKTAASYATGYVARCREWGLLRPKQSDGLYVATEFGNQVETKETNA